MSYYEHWLRDMVFFKTKSGARLDLRLYISPDAHGNIHYKTLDTHKDRNQPVASLDETTETFRAIWEHAQQYMLDAAPQDPDEA